MIIVSGKLYIRSGQRQTFLDCSRAAMVQARRTSGCRDFVVAADPLEPDRVNIYEEWESEPELEAFRGDGPDSGLAYLIERAEVKQRVTDFG